MAGKLKTEWQAAASTLGLSTAGTKAQIAERVTQFGYNASVDKGRRQSPQTSTKAERKFMTPKVNKRVVATTQDQLRNNSLAAWMVRKHLDYVSSFHISFRTADDDLNTLVNDIFKWHGAPKNFDVAGRHGRDEMFRLYELEKVTAGDAGLIKLSGIKLQSVEHDMIAKGAPRVGDDGNKVEVPDTVNEQGLIVDSFGGVDQYCICNRGPSGDKVIFDHMEAAQNVIFDAYWTRFGSQFRGVSPLTTAINRVQDLEEAFEYNLVKAKMHAIFGIAIMRDAAGSGEMGGAVGDAPPEDAETVDDPVTLTPTAINILDMNPGEKIDTVESGTPSTEFVEGCHLFIQIGMLALDIPVTSFDSRRSSFSARIADLNEYEVSAESKRTKNRYVRKEYSDWVLETLWNDPAQDWPLQKVAAAAGMTLRQVQAALEWIPAGSPWLDKFKQVKGDELAIELRVDNAQDAAKRRGGDAFRNVEKQIEVEVYERDLRADNTLPPKEPETVLSVKAQVFAAMEEHAMMKDDADES